jgi:hypothetical protein
MPLRTRLTKNFPSTNYRYFCTMRMHAWLGWIWLLVFVNAVAPKSFLHAFHAHEETCHNPGSGTVVTEQHEHCEFLRLQLHAYVAPDHNVLRPAIDVSFKQLDAPVSFYGCAAPSEFYIRGPTVG